MFYIRDYYYIPKATLPMHCVSCNPFSLHNKTLRLDCFNQHSSMVTGTRHRTGIQGQKSGCTRTVRAKGTKAQLCLSGRYTALASAVVESGPRRRPRLQTPVRQRLNSTSLAAIHGPSATWE